ncbi:MAG TPA: HAMP domain-containing sensor histidine kinase [Cyclobacteriaceae bacterium]|nr:HAMP domain-containing sensor histidine kinase [Cyclobacteriaceae bacterium]HRJ83096.1 HAMP domain-containing sensor histidine kinase [Cyclobacteriaceae bacterium]
MNEEEINKLTELLNERTMKLMERESELADRFEELEAQKEELTAAVEELIEKNNLLAERNRELDQILYRASHDLGSPVASMVGVLSLLQRETIPENFKPYCLYFEKAINQMQAVVKTLILLGQATSESLNPGVFNVQDVVEDEISQLSYPGNFSRIDFKKFYTGGTQLYTDETQFRIILKCLLANAVIFRNPGSGLVRVDVEIKPAQLNLRVTDDGEGISAETGKRIFDMFYRGSEKSVGLGMGLFMVRKIVDRLRGSLAWQSSERETVFMISIPVAPVPVS